MQITNQLILLLFKVTSNNSHSVTPAQAGVQEIQLIMDSRFRWNDIFRGTLKFVSSNSKKRCCPPDQNNQYNSMLHRIKATQT